MVKESLPSHFIDVHCHLSDERVQKEAETWIKRALLTDVNQLMMGGVEPHEWDRQEALRLAFPEVLKTSFGIHPWWVERYPRAELDQFLKLLEEKAKQADAIGETGLDFHAKRDPSRFSDQEFFFRAHVRLAIKLQKPLILHVVSAHELAMQILRELAFSQPFMVHSFSGSPAIAKEWLKLGAYLSFNGSLVWEKKFERQKKALLLTPIQNLLFETDSPDQAWHEDQKNDPSLVPEVYRAAAALLAVDLEVLKIQVAHNFSKLFQVK